MSPTSTYTCSICGKEHRGWPALAYSSPANYNGLSDQEKREIGTLEGDFCIIHHGDRTDRFIRGTLSQQVIDEGEPLEYGHWVSLSEASFQDYQDNFYNKQHEVKYFGWLSSELPGYTMSESIPTTVWTRTGNRRPEIVPHEDVDHPFVHDYYNGITRQEAEKRIHEMFSHVEALQKAKLKRMLSKYRLFIAVAIYFIFSYPVINRTWNLNSTIGWDERDWKTFLIPIWFLIIFRLYRKISLRETEISKVFWPHILLSVIPTFFFNHPFLKTGMAPMEEALSKMNHVYLIFLFYLIVQMCFCFVLVTKLFRR